MTRYFVTLNNNTFAYCGKIYELYDIEYPFLEYFKLLSLAIFIFTFCFLLIF